MPRLKKDQTKSSLTIALVAHLVVFFIVFVWAAKTGKLDPVLRVFNLVPTKKPEPPKEKPKPEPPKEQPPSEVAEEVPSNEPPATQALTSSAPNPNAPPSAAPSFFSAPARKSDEKAKPVNFGPVSAGKTTTPGKGSGSSAVAPVKIGGDVTKSGTIAKLLEVRQQAAAVTDSIGSEQISRSGSSDAADVVAKVSGASVVDGKFMVIRGLSDRYSSTTLNGGEVPSADPYRKAVQLDLFPAQMTDRIVINKTFTPDQPGGFTGGAVNIITKSFPDRPIFSFSMGSSYNTESSLQDDFLTYPGGGTDWLGMDDGTRALPDILENGIPPLPPNAPNRETAASFAARKAQADAFALANSAFQTTEFAATESKAPLNRNFSLSLGNTVLLFERPLGFFAAMSYRRDFNSYTMQNDDWTSGLTKSTSYLDQRGIEEVAWGTVFNLAYQLHPDHELSVNYLYNQNSEDLARRQVGVDTRTGNPDQLSDLNTLHFTERHLDALQFKGKHEFPALFGWKTDWLASLANTSQEEPDLRLFNFFRSPDGAGGEVFNIGDNALPQPIFPTRFFRNLEEENLTLRLDHTLPLPWWGGGEGELKLGLYQSEAERQFNERTFSYVGKAGFETNGLPNEFLEFLGYRQEVRNGRTNFVFDRTLSSLVGDNEYHGEQTIEAGYFMLDVPLIDSVRLVGGLRYETTDLAVETTTAQSGSASGGITAEDLLPALGLIWKITDKMNFRLNYGETLARPTFREMAPYASYDVSIDRILIGNPDLRRTMIKNYDVRWEWFPRPGEIFSISAFYKDMTDPIELYNETLDGGQVTWINRESATVSGLEFEVRKSLGFIDPLLDRFSLGGNIAFIKSETPLTADELNNKRQVNPNEPASRPLYDQSPYVMNFDLNYDNARRGTSAALLYNIAGERVFIGESYRPDVYQQPAGTLDFILSQRLGQKWKLKFSAKNLLNPKIERTYGAEGGQFTDLSYRKGRTFGMSLGYDF